MRDGVMRVAFYRAKECVKRSTVVRLTQIGWLWLGFTLMLRLLDRFALREDEAIYSYWALHLWRIDPYFLTVWPDKPPLFLWLLAGALHLWGASQASGRLLNIMVTLLTALIVGATARRLWGRQSGWVATTLYLLNPFALSFAPTVYTDPFLVLTGQLAFFYAISGRGLGAGLWLAATIMTKQQGFFYIPLIALALWLQPGGQGKTTAAGARWLRFLLGLLLVIAPIIYWDSTRWAVAPSPWDLSVRNYGGLELALPSQWWLRAYEWAKLLWYLTASWPVWLLLAALLIVTLWRRRSSVLGAIDLRDPPSPSSGKVEADDRIDTTNLPGRLPCQPSDALLGWLALWCGGFLVLHIITTVQLWDRYLLPLAPPLCLLATWAFMEACRCGWVANRINIGRKPRTPWRLIAGGVGLLSLLPPALTAAHGGLPIGGDHGAYSGLTAVIARIQQETSDNAILYHQRLGWHYQFYLFDEVAAGVYDLRWYPTAAYLAANAAQSPNRARLLVLPDWAPQPDLPLHLATRRLSLQPITHVDHMTLYRIDNQPQAGCDWCRCQGLPPWPIWPHLDRPGEFCQP
ncbi:MAG: hypothetical protein DYG89_14150 [Caldilinea sp. CFX5]|nr:hypothetical protein [Caldilinea sp. CFX5]